VLQFGWNTRTRSVVRIRLGFVFSNITNLFFIVTLVCGFNECWGRGTDSTDSSSCTNDSINRRETSPTRTSALKNGKGAARYDVPYTCLGSSSSGALRRV